MRILLVAALGFSLGACATTGTSGWNAIPGVTWEVGTMNGQPLLAGTTITLRFTVDAGLSGQAINGYFAQAQREGSKLEIGPIGATRVFLDNPPGAMKQEGEYLKALAKIDRWTMVNDKLELHTDGARVLTLHKKPAANPNENRDRSNSPG